LSSTSTVSSTATALVQTGPRALEVREFPFPKLPPGAALLRVEACGMCGSDVEYYNGLEVINANTYPRILGHEFVGVIEELGPDSANRKGLKVGDRVAVDMILACGTCWMCIRDPNRMFCEGYPFKPAFYGAIPTTVEPSLWGGYASHAYIHPDTILYPIPDHISALTATLWNPLAAGIQWADIYPGTTAGTTIAIFGAGQRGLSSVIAAKSAGASLVIITGLSQDEHKLALAREFGADVTIDVEKQDVVDEIMRLTNGLGVDVVVDMTAGATQPVKDAIASVRPGGFIVYYGIKGQTVPDFPIDQAIFKGVTIQTATGLSADSFRRATELIISERFPLDKLRTHVFGMSEVEHAMDVLIGRDPNEHALNVVLTPDFD
jgi:threonine dehydrogenase-like Zn-dependent dehydrogenase